MADSYNLDRFVTAQAPVFAHVQQELANGRKTTHWMWFVFPQIAGLGHSAMAQRYAIASLDEARAYLGHPVLGPRLLECTRLVQPASGRSLQAIFGSPDDMKFHSSMTLFHRARPDVPEFAAALETWFEGRPDPATEERLARPG